MRSYVGAQIRCETDDGQCFALGSLFAATHSEAARLDRGQQEVLIKFAELISAEIVNRSRNRRQRQRQIMTDILAKTRKQSTPENAERLIETVLRKIYPRAYIALQESKTGMVQLENRPPILASSAQNGLWEDLELLESLILTKNHSYLTSSQTIRAIIAPCRKQLVPQFLLVASKDVHSVFDDVDSWFVESCATILLNADQERRVAKALEARNIFLQGITHQLRTPIHGILTSTELLTEELFLGRARALSSNDDGRHKLWDPATARSIRAYLEAITNSGSELMSTVNNIIMLNRWTEQRRPLRLVSLHELDQLEEEIVRGISQVLPEYELVSKSIFFDNRLPVDVSFFTIDADLLKECLQSLVLNAVQSVQNGSVVVSISAAKGFSKLRFDIIDNGCGMSTATQRRIFEAFEKGDPHTRGAGLGLTVASKIARLMNGTVRLISSEVGHGTHFRVEFDDPGFGCQFGPRPSAQTMFKDIPRKYYEVPNKGGPSDLVQHFTKCIENQGFSRSHTSRGSLNIVSFTSDEKHFHQSLEKLDPSTVSVCLVPSLTTRLLVSERSPNCNVLFFEGPFFSARLRGILEELNGVYENLKPWSERLLQGSPGPCNQRLRRRSNQMSSCDLRSVNALLVDDNAINLRILKLYCEKRSIPYSTAVDGHEAGALYRERLHEQPFDLILTDLQMPKCDGVELTKQIRETEKNLSLSRAVIFIGEFCMHPFFNSN
ncbi:hypothetical protein BFW01_g7463 [Lasiodiplodia theobromae]|nr:hypothetical protein BFW01_g7463 [Lasiodiplodia theobromae]